MLNNMLTLYRDDAGREYIQSLRRWQTDYNNYLNYMRWSQMMVPYHMMSMMAMQKVRLLLERKS